MKIVLMVICVLFLRVSLHAQGKIIFRTQILSATPQINAPVSFAPTGELLTAPFSAQLYAVPLGGPLSTLIPDGPILPFSNVVPGHIFPGGEYAFEHFRIGQDVTIVVRAFNGANFETSSIRGESNPLSIKLGSIDGAYLTGLQPFTVDYIPEPSTFALSVVGAGLLLLWRRKSALPCE